MKKNYPKIHKACSDFELNPVMNHVFISKDVIKASNSHILVQHKTDEVFDEEFVESLPDKPILIHRIHFANIVRVGCEYHLIVKDDGAHKLLKYHYRDLWHYIPFENDGENMMTYPNTDAIWPKGKGREAINKIGLNASFLNIAAETLDFEKSTIKCEFYSESEAMTITKVIGNFPSAKALVMPVMINE